MLVRLYTWWASPLGWIPPGVEAVVDDLDGMMLCGAGYAEPVRSRPVELAVVAAPEQAVVRPKRKRAKR